MLGEAKNFEKKLGENILKEISERWGKILDGLVKEQKEALGEKLLIPENFLLIRAPKLNPEVSAVLTEPAKKRAAPQQKFQQKSLISGNLRFPSRQQSNSKPAAAPSRYYELQPSMPARRNLSWARPRL